LNLSSGFVFGPIALVHAQGNFEYTLSNSGGVTLTPGNPGSTTIIATLTAGVASNVTLSCDVTNIPANASGTTCVFAPTSVIPSVKGDISVLTVSVPTTAPYGAFNLTVTGINPAPIVPTILTVTIGAKVAVNPTATASVNDIAGTLFTIGVNVTDSPPFGGFIVAIFYNKAVLQFQGMDYSNNVFGNDVFVSSECSDGQDVSGSGNSCHPDLTFDGEGVFSLTLTPNGGLNTGVNGTLFRATFSVMSRGFSTFHFVSHDILTYPDGLHLRTVGYDGYFTNEQCGGNLCKPPVVSFIPPPRVVENRPASFNGTAVSQNSKGRITEYNWTWGLGQDIHHYNNVSALGAKPFTNVTIIFLQLGEHLVTLSAQDNYTARAYYTLDVIVFRVWVDLGLASLSIDPTTGVIPGTTVHIALTAINNGVNPENSTLTLSINDNSMAMKSIQNLGPDVESSLKYDWNTANYPPRVYKLVANLDTVKNATTGQILENDTFTNARGQIVDPNNQRIAFIQLILPLPSGFGAFLGLNLPETLGLGIVLIAVAVFAVGLVKKSRAQTLEPL